jgi:hypothetical protein
MLYVALAAIGSLCLVTLAFSALLRSQLRQAARREDLLVNQVCSLAGRPWQPPPARESAPTLDEELERFVALPERLPD